jgi:RNA polymerase sigma-70 factor (ECF subfamily)
MWLETTDCPEDSTKGAGSADDLADRLTHRDEGAFLELYDRYSRSVYRFLVHMTGSAATAEELTQGVFTVVLEALFKGKFESFDSTKGTLEGYLLGIARNLARKEFRQNFRNTSLETAEGGSLMRALCDDRFTEKVILREDLERLKTAIAELPFHFKEVLILCCLQDRSYHEAAQIVHCSVGTVASRINRAKKLLSAKLVGGRVTAGQVATAVKGVRR